MGAKKKSKKKLEEEQRRLEEEARLAEEERQRQEEEDRKRREEEERIKDELRAKHLGEESERLEAERERMKIFLQSVSSERARAHCLREEKREWERYLQCTSLPNPMIPREMNDYINAECAESHRDLKSALEACENARRVREEVNDLRRDALEGGHCDEACRLLADLSRLHELVDGILQNLVCHLLQTCDEHVNDRGDVQVSQQSSSFKFGIWFNVNKNPRLKVVDFHEICASVEIPKQLTLASVSLMLCGCAYDEFSLDCQNDLMAVGGVWRAQLFTMPPVSKIVNKWTIRQINPSDNSLRPLPYPLLPAGADPATYSTDQPSPPITFHIPLCADFIFQGQELSAGFWDEDAKQWSYEGVKATKYEEEKRQFTFSCCRLLPVALLQRRTRLLPYEGWSLRPTGGETGNTVAFSLTISGGQCVDFEIGPGYAALSRWDATDCCGIKSLIGERLAPGRLLERLASLGAYLIPGDRDAKFVRDSMLKDLGVERRMCEDVGLISNAVLISGSKWNRHVGNDECICRISEITDWEGGGRTEQHHLERIFTKEKDTGQRRVLVVIRRGGKGVAFSEALDRLESYSDLPGYDTPEYAEHLYGHLHINLVALLEAKQWGGEGEEPQGPWVRAETVERAKLNWPDLSQKVSQMLFALRIFSFG